jgi:two-component system chemotaxis response regulator CheB
MSAPPATQPIRVVVTDDSLVAREMISQILESDPSIEVVGIASDGMQAIELVERLHPDLVTMDIHMPGIDGLTATERIMAYTPTPILVVSSSVHGEGMGRAFDALSAGALEVIRKPEPKDWADLQRIGAEVIGKVKVLSRVKVVTHISGRRGRRADWHPHRVRSHTGSSLVAMASSTGGPSALEKVLAALPASFPAPIVVAQHIADGFIAGLATWLSGVCQLRVKVAEEGEELARGTVYLSPTLANLAVDSSRATFVPLTQGQLYVPSADILFHSVAATWGPDAVGVVLTGMGADGVRGLRSLRDAGATTIAQNEATSTVWGMPRAAVECGAAESVLPLGDIASSLQELVAVAPSVHA